MPRAAPGIVSFNAGELSPLLEGRTDITKYAQGCKTLENFIPCVQGPARRRPGSIFVSEVKNSAKRTWLSVFRFSNDQSYILEWGDLYVRFYTNRGQVLNGGVAYEIASPYGAADLTDANGLFQLVFAQSADVIYVTHRAKTFAQYKLSRLGPTNWTLAPLAQIGGPFAPLNAGNNPVVYASAQRGTGLTLTASGDIFTATRMNTVFLLIQEQIRDIRPWAAEKSVARGQLRRFNGVTYEAVDGEGTSPYTTGTVPPTHLNGTAWDTASHPGGGKGVLWEYRDAGQGYCILRARGVDPTPFTPIAITAITSAKPPVVTLASPVPFLEGDLVFITGIVGMTELNDRFYRVHIPVGNTFSLQEDKTGGSPVNVDSTAYGTYSSGGTVTNQVWTCTADVADESTAGVVNQLPAEVVGSQNATSQWAYAAWSPQDGYPSCCAFFRGRLAFGRDGDRWFSVSQDFENFNSKTPAGLVTSDMAISITEPEEEPLEWMVEGRVLVEATAAGENAISEINTGQAFGPANVATKKQLRHGSRAVVPVVVDESVIYVQTSGIKARAIKYAFAFDNYQSRDLTVPAEHMGYGGFIQMAYQQEPDAVVWFARADGTLVGLTFNEEQQVNAWHRHPMGLSAVVESVASIPAPDGSQDDLWLIVKRTINGVTRRYVEYLSPHFLTGNSLAAQAVYVDSASVVVANPAASVVIGLAYLEGVTVRVLADGASHPDVTVSGGQVTLNRKATNIVLGIPYTAKLTTMPLEAGSANGTAQGKKKRVQRINVRFANSLGGHIGRDDDVKPIFDAIDYFRDPSEAMDSALPVFNGLWPPSTYDFAYPYGYEQEARLTLYTDEAFPMTVVGIYPTVETSD